MKKQEVNQRDMVAIYSFVNKWTPPLESLYKFNLRY